MKTTLLIIPIFLLWSCDRQSERIADPSDYNTYLSYTTTSSTADEEMIFWSDRLNQNSEDEVATLKLAGLYSGKFKASNDIDDIKTSDSLYQAVLNTTPGGKVGIYQSLATNAITQHQFQSAKVYIEKAIALKDQMATSLMILTDVALELGDYARARHTLKQFRNKNSFAYLIREAKLEDHEGDLAGAIVSMERAYQRIENNRPLAEWTLTNLADMYGHAGRISDAYQNYLDALKINPHDDYALKGIAWIVLSNDHNPTEAKRIINILASRKRMPEACLFLAEVATLEGDENEKMNQLKRFKSFVSHPDYKNMYHKYLAAIEAEDFHNVDESIAIARAEIKNRPTPQSFDLLAWGLYHQGHFAEALEIAIQNVDGQTFEPDAYYHMGMINLANGDKVKSKHYLDEALKSQFELGPSISKKIADTLKTL